MVNARPTPFDFIQKATRKHRLRHWCSAYAFKDGAGLIDIARRYSPARVIELGTALGFTACCLASSGKAVRVDTIEGDSRHAALAQSNIEAASLAECITVHPGRFDEVLRSLLGRYDLAFFDGGSPSIPIIEQLRTLLDDDGILVCANLPRASAGQARDLRREFDNADRWLRIGAIEDGGTLILRKQGK
ncbi:MAG: class I SAM-dependent methyltransferase [Rhizomicrobium sp.]